MFRGIVLFGLPGSGKTTIGKLLADRLLDLKLYEASRAIIYPLAANPITRVQAREIYQQLARDHGPDIIGRIIEEKFPNSIMAGARGLANAQYLYQHRFLVVYLYAPSDDLLKRGASMDDIDAEETLYQTSAIRHQVHLAFDTTTFSSQYIADFITKLYRSKECQKCANIDFNPVTPILDNGYCIVCDTYSNNFNEQILREELEFLKTFRKPGQYDVMVGMSGGKDSTVTTYKLLELGFTPLGFTFDIGYYPQHIMSRAASIAKLLGVDHEIIEIKNNITSPESYELTKKLYAEPESEQLAQKFRQLYIDNRQHYSVKDTTIMPFVRSCQLCRKTVIPSYYKEAVKRGISLVVLGINEWTCLSQPNDQFLDQRNARPPQGTSGIRQGISWSHLGIRRLQPTPTSPIVYIVHLPFLLRLTRVEMESVLNQIGWTPPTGEELIEANTNSCLFAAATLEKARHMLGFNPDITRLSREVTVGFITKEEAKHALAKHYSTHLTLDQLF